MTSPTSDKFYDVVASKYDALLDADPLNVDNRREVEFAMRAVLDAGARVLDFGSGTGSDWEWLLDAGYEVCCYEPSAGMRDAASQKPAADRVRLVDNLDTLDGSADARLFDGILANFAVLNHVADLATTFRLFAQVLRPGGQLLVVVLNPGQDENPASVEFEGQRTAVYVHSIADLTAASGELDLVANRPLSEHRFRLLCFVRSGVRN